jgi:23S rRNA (pseudouridine1915-N3)-methyltransferase
LKLLVLAVGHRPAAWVDAGFHEYARRMPREAPLELLAIRPETRGHGAGRTANTAKILEAEAKRITSALPRSCYTVALDQRGDSFTTEGLARRLAQWQSQGSDVAFLIGGADGLAEVLKRNAGFCWSLSELTLPHALVRIILAEQLYRAMSVLKGHPYHRG